VKFNEIRFQLKMARGKPKLVVLKGWKAIAQFLGQPSSTVQRWAREGMPVERKGRTVQAFADKLNLWLERETHEPVQIATETSDLSAELRRGLSYVRKRRKPGKKA
jgi:phage terminase Nu1 subunit (DNA packaging protein)